MKDLTRILLMSFWLLLGCSSKQEPIFHLFEHSTSYPDYNEAAYLKRKGFEETKSGDTIWLTKESSKIHLKFMILHNELVEKRASMIMTKFDTLLATGIIEDQFGGRKTTNWNKTFLRNESVYSTLVEFEDDFYVVTLDSLTRKVLLKTSSDLFHRVVHD